MVHACRKDVERKYIIYMHIYVYTLGIMKLPCSEAHENQEVDLLYVHERENSVLESGEKHMAEVAPPLRPETLMMQNSDTLYTARVLTKKDS